MNVGSLRLDPISRLVACRKLDEATVLSREKLEALLADPEAARLDVARAHRELADGLLMADKPAEASPHVFESRRRYRPFRNEPKLAGEVDLLLAAYAIEDDRSSDGQQMLADVLATCERVPSAQLVYARALRLTAHLEIVRGEFENGDELMQKALAATEQRAIEEQPTDPMVVERFLMRSQYLFTCGEVAIMVDQPARSIDFTRAALDLCETVFAEEKAYVDFARDRADFAFRVAGEPALAERIPGTRTKRS